MQIEEIKPVVTPGATKYTLSYEELMDSIRTKFPSFPQGGMFELKFDPGTERVTIIHTT